MTIFDKFFSPFSYEIGIDLGTANTLIYVKGKGIAIREPSMIARHKKTKEILAIGSEAKNMFGKTPSTIETVRPLRGGVISDFDATTAMISYYIKELNRSNSLISKFIFKPKVVIGISSSVTEVERRAVWEAALTAGARIAYLIEEPMASAIGAGVSVFAPTGIMIVDVGGGTTEIAVISLGGIVVSRSLRIAGDDMNLAIMNYIRLRHGLLIGERTAEDLKIKIGSAYQNRESVKTKNAKLKNIENKKNKDNLENGKSIEEDIKVDDENELKVAIIRGRDIETGLPKSLKISNTEVREALAPILSEIIEAIADVLQDSPPELTSDILEHGILLTGGGAMLKGFDDLIIERTNIPVVRAEDPLTTVVRGCAKVLEDDNLLNRVKVTGGLV